MVAYAAAFSPDGSHIVTAAHPETIDGTQTAEYHVKVWRTPEPIHSLQDPVLWTATTYCPSVEQRVKLLSFPKTIASEQYERCRQRVNAARVHKDM